VVALAAAINPYMAAMCLLVALTGVGRLLTERRCTLTRAALLVASTMGVLGTSMLIVGVLASGDANAYWALGYGQMSFNLNSLANPMQYGSLLLPALPLSFATQYEGYSYLGAGLLALLVINLAVRPHAIAWLADRRLMPLLGLATVATFLAASTTVTFGARTLFEMPLPSWVIGPLQGLRASGRLSLAGVLLGRARGIVVDLSYLAAVVPDRAPRDRAHDPDSRFDAAQSEDPGRPRSPVPKFADRASLARVGRQGRQSDASTALRVLAAHRRGRPVQLHRFRKACRRRADALEQLLRRAVLESGIADPLR
jgi:hypothetical protein